MKNLSLIGLLLISLTALSFNGDQQPKIYNFKLTDAQVGKLWNCLELSNANHQDVKEIQSLIQSQYTIQLKDSSTKK